MTRVVNESNPLSPYDAQAVEFARGLRMRAAQIGNRITSTLVEALDDGGYRFTFEGTDGDELIVAHVEIAPADLA